MIKAVLWAMILSFLSLSARADFINGQLDFFGGADYTRDGGVYTEIDFSGAFVYEAIGDFSSIADFANDFSITPVSFVDPWAVTEIDNLWEVGGFSFDLTNITINDGVTVGGFGTVSHADFDDTTMYWSLTTQDLGRASFSASTVTEPTSLALLGLGLIGLGLARRKSAA